MKTQAICMSVVRDFAAVRGCGPKRTQAGV